MTARETIEDVVRDGLCTGCGTCVAICPHGAVRMEETPGGLLVAKVSTESCNTCGLCLRVCGGSHLAAGVLPENVDPFKGTVLAAYCGHATDPEIRLRGQSGGVATALLACLLESGQIDRAMVNRMPEDGSLRPEPFLAGSRAELLSSHGSKYCPVALNAAIPRDIGKNNEKLAMVGLPCHLHSLRNAQQLHRHWKEGVGATIGLFCDRTLAYGAIDYLIKRGSTSSKDVLAFRYRDKTQGGWPGSISITTRSGENIRVQSIERQVIKDFFTPPRCRVCFDKMNILSDIAVGDAWGVDEDNMGASVLIARTPMGMSLIEQAQKTGYLSLVPIEPEKIFIGQGVEVRRRQWSAFTKVGRELKRQLPDYGFSPMFIEKDTTALEDSVKRHYRWANKYFAGKTSHQIVTSVRLHQLIPTMRRKLKTEFRHILSKIKNSLKR